MSRYIDVDELYVDWYDSFVADDGTEYENIPLITKGQIDDAPTIDIPTWIPCSERLPKTYKRVLTTSKDGRVQENFLIALGNDAWCYDSLPVIAWMPLPQPYKEKNDE